MKSTEKKNPFAGIDVEGIIKKSIHAHVVKEAATLPDDTIQEAYVAEPKQFKQVTEFVSQKTKNSHLELYKGYIDSLNKVSSKLDTAELSEATSTQDIPSISPSN